MTEIRTDTFNEHAKRHQDTKSKIVLLDPIVSVFKSNQVSALSEIY